MTYFSSSVGRTCVLNFQSNKSKIFSSSTTSAMGDNTKEWPGWHTFTCFCVLLVALAGKLFPVEAAHSSSPESCQSHRPYKGKIPRSVMKYQHMTFFYESQPIKIVFQMNLSMPLHQATGRKNLYQIKASCFIS